MNNLTPGLALEIIAEARLSSSMVLEADSVMALATFAASNEPKDSRAAKIANTLINAARPKLDGKTNLYVAKPQAKCDFGNSIVLRAPQIAVAHVGVAGCYCVAVVQDPDLGVTNLINLPTDLASRTFAMATKTVLAGKQWSALNTMGMPRVGYSNSSDRNVVVNATSHEAAYDLLLQARTDKSFFQDALTSDQTLALTSLQEKCGISPSRSGGLRLGARPASAEAPRVNA